jgi:hypothetical protein
MVVPAVSFELSVNNVFFFKAKGSVILSDSGRNQSRQGQRFTAAEPEPEPCLRCRMLGLSESVRCRVELEAI